MRWLRVDDGQGLVEYALIIAVIAVAIIVVLLFMSGNLQNLFSNVGNNLT
ncbi:MAG: Flp family type IVb pilin [Candidatus Limnocylindria bacterium]|nr:Flp family type IVb pilin [Candidatus Limnocylindria bacterium]